MINSTSKTENILRSEALASRPAQARPVPARPADTDTIRASGQETLRAALDRQPEIRPEVVERAQKLAVDANYPPKELIRRLSEMMVNSQDLSD